MPVLGGSDATNLIMPSDADGHAAYLQARSELATESWIVGTQSYGMRERIDRGI